jgi:hypothetical protein
MALEHLDASSIGWLFQKRAAGGLIPEKPAARFALLGAMALFTTLVLATLSHALVGRQGEISPFTVLVHGDQALPRAMTLNLMQDPVGMAVVVIALATPIFLAVQADAINELMPMIERNAAASGINIQNEADVNEVVTRANQRLSWIGSWWYSSLVALIAITGAVVLYYHLRHDGLLTNWNTTDASSAQWKRAVYDGWWANLSQHRVMAVGLTALGAYMFYFLLKQLTMGFVFALFGREVNALGFGVVPSLEFNSDGRHGLRNLRKFMRWTYGSSVAHFALLLGVFFVWLPASPATYLFSTLVFLTNATVVIYPSVIAHRTAVTTKIAFTKQILNNQCLTREERCTLIDAAWSAPSFPFRTSSSFSALTLYLFLPLILAVVSAILS